MELLIQNNGRVRCLYSEILDLHQLGSLSIQRGSYVEPTADGRWTANLSPVNGPLLGPFAKRTTALAVEERWLLDHWLIPCE
ncbi:hypothetical protein [uncultured Rubinisphaera sp.]|uniref:hypothetical protein n=1 Tax=uncultured Rubinisphaera sp. TaxID=1678686 RepID=UPI0030D8D3B5